MKKKKVLREALTDFREGRIHVLVGTQMVAKGLNFPGVKLVGIVNADTGFQLPDFRAAERTFSLTVTSMRAPARMVWSDGMPLGLFRGVRTYRLDPAGSGTAFSMTEEFSGPLAGLITKAIPDLSESFNQFADGLKAAAERTART